jgi:hypothetical protein
MSTSAEAARDTEPAPSKVGLWEDFVDIFYAPSSVFARRADGKFGMQLLILVVAATALFFLTKNAVQPIMDAEFARQSAAMLKKNPNMTAEQIAGGRSFFESFGFVIVAFGLTISVFLTGLSLWVVGKLFDAKESASAAIMIATYAEVPRLVQALLNAAQGLMMSPDSLTSMNSVSLSPARFMNPDTSSPVLLGLVSRFDLFTIWVTVLLAIGLRVLGRVPKQQAAIAAAIVWLLGAVPAILGALRSS